jgi:3-dehydroquinate synthase
VLIETGSLLMLPTLAREYLQGRRLVMISDSTVDRLYDEWTQGTDEARQLGAKANEAGIRLQVEARLTFPPGEGSKTRETWSSLSDQLLTQGLGRDTGIIALGGGVVGDLAGFVAATYLRGVPFLQVPTTLLAMLDASVGGKVGVNTDLGKNLLGAFHPPVAVVMDPLTLLSQPEREYRQGLAEAVKHGLIADRSYFEWIEQRVRPLKTRELRTLTELIQRSVAIKAEVVAADERESGRRAVLNAGHTVAHAVEQATHFTVPHGEAVAVGLMAECRIAERLGVAPAGIADRVTGLLSALGFRARLRGATSLEAIVSAMASDKKNRGGAIRFALPRALGSMHESSGGWTVAVSQAEIAAGVSAIA